MTSTAGEPHATEDAEERVHIRHVGTHEEFVACVELQAETWGAGFREIVPATILKIAQRLGGVTAGAFAGDGTLVGFVFGVTGVERGEIVHWSDMLAVRAGMQNHGLGRRLKEFQRDAVRAAGAVRMYWTFDPLVARNAHFNLNRLGARVTEYVPDMYGSDTGSAMHSGLGTDRFIVMWPLASPDTPAAPAGGDGPGGGDSASAATARLNAPVLNAGGVDGDSIIGRAQAGTALPPVVHVEIPPDVFDVQARSVDDAVRWRATSRRAFEWALANGYTVSGFHRDQGNGRAFYRLTRRPYAPTGSADQAAAPRR